jgi:spoIIIJ-associated protein
VEWVETTGRTVAEAVDGALDQLGVDEEEAEVQVLEEPQKGLFGRLRSEARVRARVRPTRPRPKAERRERRRRGDRERRSRGRAETTGNGQKGSRRDRAASTKPLDREVADNGGGHSQRGQATAGSAASAEGRSNRRRRRRGGRGGAKREEAAVSNDSAGTAGTKTEEGPQLDLERQREAVEAFLQGLVQAMGRPEATVAVQAAEEDTLEAEVEGEELGFLVGPKGQTLQAVQELVRSMVQRRFVGEAHARVRVDVGGYRQRRREALERFSRQVAEEVLTTGRAKALDPMGASDRKIVHDVANEIDGVTTISEGEEPSRRVVIQPA